MKRNTDVPGPTSGSDRDSKKAAPAVSSCASAVELAGVLLAHTMEEAQAPISELSEALVRVARTLNGALPAQDRHPEGPAQTGQAARDAITRDLAVCIENLQFHDRLMQQLTRVRDILAALAANRRLADIPAPPASKGSVELF